MKKYGIKWFEWFISFMSQATIIIFVVFMILSAFKIEMELDRLMLLISAIIIFNNMNSSHKILVEKMADKILTKLIRI